MKKYLIKEIYKYKGVLKNGKRVRKPSVDYFGPHGICGTTDINNLIDYDNFFRCISSNVFGKSAEKYLMESVKIDPRFNNRKDWKCVYQIVSVSYSKEKGYTEKVMGFVTNHDF